VPRRVEPGARGGREARQGDRCARARRRRGAAVPRARVHADRGRLRHVVPARGRARRSRCRARMIVATGPVPPLAEELLGPILVAARGELESLLPEVEVLIARGGTTVTAETIAAAPRLRVIARSGVGFSEVDVDAATRRGIPVVLAPTAGANAVAEGALALILALAKRLPEHDRPVHERRWAERDNVRGRDLRGAALGSVRSGRLGR